jgi:hypothetical protein
VNDGCTLAMHVEHMATEMGLKSYGEILIYQDETSAI